MKNIKLPLWLKFPAYPRPCQMWRTNTAQDYIWEFHDWFRALTPAEKARYNADFPKPRHWDAKEENRVEYYRQVFPVVKWTDGGTPAYGLKNLMSDIKSGAKKEYIFFYEGTPSADGKIDSACLSQWWEEYFPVCTLQYPTAEHYMMRTKAIVFGDDQKAVKIMDNASPESAKAMGKEVKDFSSREWSKISYSVVLNGNYWKFASNPALRAYLLSTGDKVLVEASPTDKIWGAGLSADDEKIKNPSKWKGENLMGFALMEVREEIRRVFENYNKAL